MTKVKVNFRCYEGVKIAHRAFEKRIVEITTSVKTFIDAKRSTLFKRFAGLN